MENSRVSISVYKIGSAAGETGTTYFLPSGNKQHPAYTDAYLKRYGSLYGSTISIAKKL